MLHNKIDYSETFNCATCGKTFPCWIAGSFSGNYGKDGEDKKHCLPCCGENDKKHAMETGRWTGYLVQKDSWSPLPNGFKPHAGRYKVTNWPGTISIDINYWTESRNNIGGTKTHVWFKFPCDEYVWYGYQIGDMNQILHARRTKKKTFV